VVLLGQPHHYEVTAVYRDPAGREATARPVVASAVPRGVAHPVDDLVVEPVTTTDGSMRVRLSWTAGEYDDVEVRRSDRQPPWGRGEHVRAEQARSFGAELRGGPTVRGDRASMECAVPAGQHVYVPFSFGAGGAVVGRAVTMGVTAPVGSSQVRRTGDRLIVTWLWPDGIGLAQVRWTTPDSGSRTFVISRAKYDAESGCVLSAASGGGTVEVRALAVGPTGTAQSPPVISSVPPRAARVRYTVTRPVPPADRPLLGKLRDRIRDRRRVVTLSSDQRCADQGVELVREPGVHLHPGEPVGIEIEVPATISRPYWIRCFVAKPDGYAVTDPPIDQMKVS
jgi:hypothetical protein